MRNKSFIFDTNTLLSALLNDDSVPAKAYNKARKEGVLLISKEIVEEYTEVFSRKKFEKYVPLLYRLIFIEKLISEALPVIIHSPVIACRDPKDDKFLSLAVNGQAGCVISGDSDLLILHPFHGIPILKPADFLNDYTITEPWH